MTEPGTRQVDANGVALNVYTLGRLDQPKLVMLHGMRDVALSLLPIAERLCKHFHILLPDLRGHGRSERPGNYSLPQYLFDLHCVYEQLLGEPAALLGHSLGGQITSRFTALFPDLVRAAVIVEGLGPPARAMSAERILQVEGQRLLRTLSTPAWSRTLPSIEFAAERLLANNPRLKPDLALTLARQATEFDADGNLLWAFDSRVQSVFLSTGAADGERYWSAIRCPTLIISGALASEYWREAVPGSNDWDGSFADGELEQRLSLFQNYEHLSFAHSGHMVHFDEPDNLADKVGEFLRRRL